MQKSLETHLECCQRQSRTSRFLSYSPHRYVLSSSLQCRSDNRYHSTNSHGSTSSGPIADGPGEEASYSTTRGVCRDDCSEDSWTWVELLFEVCLCLRGTKDARVVTPKQTSYTNEDGCSSERC